MGSEERPRRTIWAWICWVWARVRVRVLEELRRLRASLGVEGG